MKKQGFQRNEDGLILYVVITKQGTSTVRDMDINH